MVPITGNAEPFELLALHTEPMFGKGAAFLPEFNQRHLVLVFALGAILLFDFPFDRQAVAIPAGDIIGVKTEHLLGTGHQIFQNLVERMPDMNIAIGIGRAVMQDKARTPFRGLTQLLIKINLVPAL